MTRRMETLAARGLLALAATVVALDWFLPSSITLFLDELALMGVIWAMRKIHKFRK